MDHMHVHGSALPLWPQLLLALPFVLLIAGYGLCLYFSARKGRTWPVWRTLFWFAGCVFALAAVAGPLAVEAHHDFYVHMITHLLLGMLGPLLMVLAAPVTLLLRALPVTAARKVSGILKWRIVHLLTDPFVASILNMGALWVLYTTPLYSGMHESNALHVLIHAHVFIAGYVFTASMISKDPMPHRPSYLYRSVALVLALASHGILSKYLYANPPAGVPAHQAEAGGMLMFYGGDLVDAVIVFLLLRQWYHAARPKPHKTPQPVTG
ncbi:cytochrome c oxidase assembly protein [Alteribacter natronophilus]|uniref:cytochrome c oxidase assembly protein n=1 Tax=Alteribacter natronophilus TaxID=2583810 RepID=UPI00110EFA52|nr:cytochrome c oxidase assembly protein [Alteribacter natronophilus]TMW72791.1 cytochrome c oxidase assembly protein [Alteribacter natronophilus]